MKKIVDPNLLAKLEGKQPVPTPAPKIKAESKEVTDAELLEKLEADNKRLTTVNELLNNAIDVKVIEVPKRVEVPKIVEKEVIKEVPVEKIVEDIVNLGHQVGADLEKEDIAFLKFNIVFRFSFPKPLIMIINCY